MLRSLVLVLVGFVSASCASAGVLRVDGLRPAAKDDPLGAEGSLALLGQLPTTCTLVTLAGSTFKTITNCQKLQTLTDIPSDTYTLRVEGQCQPATEAKITIDGSTSTGDLLKLGLPSPARRYLKAETTLEEYPDALTNRQNEARPGGVYMNKSAGPVTAFPPNTVFDLVRTWPDSENPSRCSRAIVLVVDAGGRVPRTDRRRNVHPIPADVTGRWYVANLDDLTDHQDGPSAAEYLAQQQQAKHQQAADRAAQAQQAAAAVEAEEVRTGRCEQSRASNMQNVAAGLGRLASDGLSGGGESFMVIDKKIIVATPAGTATTLDAKAGGSEHVFLVSFAPMSLDVQSAGYPVSAHSPYETVVRSTTGGRVDSRTLHANMGEQLQAKATGRGCALLVLMQQL
jgi:hypothetical protein